MTKLRCTITNGNPIMVYPCPSGDMVVTICKWKPIRSLQANKLFHAICGEIARVTGMDAELVKEGVKEQYGVKVRYRETMVCKPSHLMDSAEMCELIQGAELEAGELGIDIYGIGQ